MGVLDDEGLYDEVIWNRDPFRRPASRMGIRATQYDPATGGTVAPQVVPTGGGEAYNNPRTWGEFGSQMADVLIPHTPLDIGLTVATLPTGGLLGRALSPTLRAAAGVGGYLLDPDPAEAARMRLPPGRMTPRMRRIASEAGQQMDEAAEVRLHAGLDEAPANPNARIGHNEPPEPLPAPHDDAMTRATTPRPGAGVPLLEGDDLATADWLSPHVRDFRRAQMALPVAQRVTQRPEDRLFSQPDFNRNLPIDPQARSQAEDIENLRLSALRGGGGQRMPGSTVEEPGGALNLSARYGPTQQRIVDELAPIARLMRGEDVPDATPRQREAANSGAFYNMRPVYDFLVDELGYTEQEAMRRIRQEAQAIAGTSPRTATTENVINSGYLQNRMARGRDIDPDTLQALTGKGSGYGMIYGTHGPLTEAMLTGRGTLAQNPKPDTFAGNIAGDRSATTADVHNVRAINMLYNDTHPGELPRSSFETAAGYRRYREAYAEGGPGMDDKTLRELLVSRPSGQAIRGQEVSTEYPVYNDITTRIGERLGLTPADTQALMWFYYGDRTGLESTAHTIPELLNQRLSITAQGLGISQREAARLYFRNMIPLAGVAGAAALPGARGLLGGDNEQ